MSSPILDMENINMRLGPSNMGRCGNGRGVHFGGVTMHPLTVLHPMVTRTSNPMLHAQADDQQMTRRGLAGIRRGLGLGGDAPAGWIQKVCRLHSPCTMQQHTARGKWRIFTPHIPTYTPAPPPPPPRQATKKIHPTNNKNKNVQRQAAD